MLLKGTRTAVLTVAALDLLYAQAQEEGCCPVCCGMCWVIDDMIKNGDLDKTVMKAPESMYENQEWWDKPNYRVSRSWLASVWPGDLGCHGPEEDSDEAEAGARS